jgi:hypothetical protein
VLSVLASSATESHTRATWTGAFAAFPQGVRSFLIPLSDKAEFFDGELRREHKRKTISQLGQKSLHGICIIYGKLKLSVSPRRTKTGQISSIRMRMRSRAIRFWLYVSVFSLRPTTDSQRNIWIQSGGNSVNLAS